MRTFPKQLAKFREIVEERGERLRKMSFDELEGLAHQPVELVNVDGRDATISLIVLRPVYPLHDTVQIVVQGFLSHRFMPGKSVALDGFYKHKDGSVIAMKREEFWSFD